MQVIEKKCSKLFITKHSIINFLSQTKIDVLRCLNSAPDLNEILKRLIGGIREVHFVAVYAFYVLVFDIRMQHLT